jgi:hypothetical protein
MSAKLQMDPIGVENRLHDLFGVTKEQLIQVVVAGVDGRNECTANHPASMPGTRCWGESTKALRDLFLPLGWRADNTDNIPSVVHPKRRIKIAVTNGNYETGIESGHPQPISEKGDGSQRAVFPNQTGLQPLLDASLNDDVTAGSSFYYLCIFCGAEMVRAELLCPIFDTDGLFKDFHERIAIISDRDDHGPRRRSDIPEAPAGDAGFDIPVTRKQAAA